MQTRVLSTVLKQTNNNPGMNPDPISKCLDLCHSILWMNLIDEIIKLGLIHEKPDSECIRRDFGLILYILSFASHNISIKCYICHSITT